MRGCRRRADWKRLLGGVAVLLGLAGCVEHLDTTPVASGECPTWGNYRPLFYGNEPSAYIGCDQNVNLLNMVEPDGGYRLRPAARARGWRAPDLGRQEL